MSTEQTTQTTQTTETGGSLVTGGAATVTAPVFTPDATKSAEENAAAQKLFDEKTAADKKTADEKAATEKKAADEKAAADKANDTRQTPFKLEEIKLPEGFTIDEATSKSFTDLVNKFGIPRDAAGELVKLQTSLMQGLSEKGTADWDTMQDTWRKEVQADADIGGTKWQGVQSAISKTIDQYGSPELRQAFDLTGAGNNPHVLRYLSKMAAALTEGKPAISGQPTTGAKGLAEKMYDHPTSQPTKT